MGFMDVAISKNEIRKERRYYLLPSVDRSKTPYFYGLPKIHKDNCPLRPIFSCVGSYFHPLASHLATILCPLLGIHPTHLKDTSSFISQLQSLQVDWSNTCMA